MADKRSEKLFAARKMLKQHQEKQKKRELNDSPTAENPSPSPITTPNYNVPFENGSGSPVNRPPLLPSLSNSSNERLNDVVARLEEQISLQRSSIEMALGEKMSLQRNLDSVNEELNRSKGSCEELTNRLKASRTLVAKLEKETAQASEARAQHNAILHRLEMSLSQQRAAAESSRSEADAARAEVARLLKDKESMVSEFGRLELTLAEKESQLSMATIRLQQVGNGEAVGGSSEETIQLRKRAEAAEQQLAAEQLQFEEYMSSVGRQLHETSANYEKAAGEKAELEARVLAMVEHVAWLERQVQPQNLSVSQTQQNELAPIESQQKQETSNRITQLEKELESVRNELECTKLEFKTTKCELENTKAELESAKIEMEKAKNDVESARAEAESTKLELERLAAEVPDAQLLQAAMESDKVAATRAITQNQQLKQQLTELQSAYVQMQDSKLEIAEQMERHKREIKDLNNELAEYIKQEVVREGVQNGTTSAAATVVSLVDGCCQTTYHDLAAVSGDQTNNVTPEAAALLQDKFMATMNRLAALSDEKQRLEHLVVQLQSETDTIGEYITLYQMQRCKLQERASERDQLLEALSREKEELRSKLAEITALVPQVLGKEVSVGDKAVEVATIASAYVTESEQTAPAVQEIGSCEIASPTTNGSDKNCSSPISQSENSAKTVNKGDSAAAAERVLELLNEVASSGLVAADRAHGLNEPCPNTFHPCSVCSGRLITV